MALSLLEVVPESISLSVLQHQICNFHIKHGMSHMETTHVPSLHLTMTATIQYIQRLIFRHEYGPGYQHGVKPPHSLTHSRLLK